MALVRCPDCGKSVSDKATACNSCGCPIGGGGSVADNHFEQRIKEYEKEKYKVQKRSGDSVEMMAIGAKHYPKGTIVFTYFFFVLALIFIIVGLNVWWNSSAMIGFTFIIIGVLLVIPIRPVREPNLTPTQAQNYVVHRSKKFVYDA